MSYIISDRQYLSSNRRKAKYVPYKTRLDSCTHEELEVTFGHPLYTFVADFLEISPNLTGVPGDGFEFPIIPDGCVSIIIILNKGEIRGYLCGVIEEIQKIILHENEIAFIARYLPGGVRPFLREPIRTYTNRSCSLSEVLPNYSLLFSAFAKSSAFSERLLAFSKTMRPQYLDKKEAHYLLNYCVDKIYDRKGNIKISDLSKEAGFSERYIGKLFDQWVGISPKLYAEIMRFQFSLEQLEEIEIKPDRIILDTALDSGFFDHAHMNRCYQRFLHCTTGTLSKFGFEGLDLSNVPKLIP
ncbi:MAG TPA: helix-turn-helix domain-containing protein [Clostridia bacterium]|nr:helix-turn-helix domain-containing protein [Clostridia bacterium]